MHSVRTFPHKYCPVPSKRLSTLLSAVISSGAGSPSKELVTDGCSSEGRKGRTMEEETTHMAILTLHIRNEVNKSCTQSLFPFRLLFGMEIGTGFEGRKKNINNWLTGNVISVWQVGNGPPQNHWQHLLLKWLCMTSCTYIHTPFTLPLHGCTYTKVLVRMGYTFSFKSTMNEMKHNECHWMWQWTILIQLHMIHSEFRGKLPVITSARITPPWHAPTLQLRLIQFRTQFRTELPLAKLVCTHAPCMPGWLCSLAHLQHCHLPAKPVIVHLRVKQGVPPGASLEEVPANFIGWEEVATGLYL